MTHPTARAVEFPARATESGVTYRVSQVSGDMLEIAVKEPSGRSSFIYIPRVDHLPLREALGFCS